MLNIKFSSLQIDGKGQVFFLANAGPSLRTYDDIFWTF